MTLNIIFSEVLVVGVLCLCTIVDLGLLHRYFASENPFSHYGVVCAIYMCNVGDVGVGLSRVVWSIIYLIS